MGYAIAIDGPSGAGKSTIARLCAKELGFIYIDTGAMYRAAALYFMENGIDVDNDKAVANTIEDIDISLDFIGGVQHVYLCGKDVSQRIRMQDCADNTSKIATVDKVREKLVALQQKMAENTNVVMDGRDIGTVVLKDAFLKIYLDAKPAIRAARRFNEFEERGVATDYETVLNDVVERDKRDMRRINSPLKLADDAIYIDSSEMKLTDATNRIVALAKEKMSASKELNYDL